MSQNVSLARSDLEACPLTDIGNFDELLREIARHLRTASHFGVSVPFDAYFFFVRRSGTGGTVTMSLDDTDNIEGNADFGHCIVAANVRGAIEALERVLAYAVTAERRGEYMDRAKVFLEGCGRGIVEEIDRACEC